MSEAGSLAVMDDARWVRQLRRNKAAMVSAVLLVIVAIAALAGPWFLPEGYGEPTRLQFSPPTWKHPLGTDLLGRDMLYRVLAGARISLVVGLAGAMVSLIIGTTYGLISGYAGGKVDSAMMRLVDILYAVPRLIIVPVFINAFDDRLKEWLVAQDLSDYIGYSKILILIVVLGFIEWLTMARIVRGQVLALKSQQFVIAAQSIGQSHSRIVIQHILPNTVGVVVIYLTLTIPAVILDESFLSFLGLGVVAPEASWGTLLSEGAAVINPIRSYWWLLVFPAVAMSLTLLALNFLGDALRDALDPRSR